DPIDLRLRPGPGVRPPVPGPLHAGSGPTVVFAVTKLFLGDTDRDGTPDPANGWKHLGFDVDGAITNCSGDACEQEFLDQCRPAAEGWAAVALPDGDDGTDNGFGHNIMPILRSLDFD